MKLEKEDLYDLYWIENKSLTQIAKIYNIDRMTVYNNMKKFGIPRRSDVEGTRLIDKNKENNPMFGKKRSSESIKRQSETLKNTIKSRGSHWSKGVKLSETTKQKMKKYGAENNNWRGGIRKHEGYIEIYMPDHPFCNKSNKTVYEHRLVMEKHIKRYLKTDEVVHHINGKKDDNRIENLQIMTSKEHLLLHANLRKTRCEK